MNRIRTVRQSRGVSQESLGEVLGLGQSAMSKLENEKVPITLDHMRKIASFLGCTVGDLENEPALTAEVYDAAMALQQMPDNIRRSATRIVYNLSKLAPEDAARLAAVASALLGTSSDQTAPKADELGMESGGEG